MENKQLKSFKDLKVWQKSVDLAVLVYSVTEIFPKSELYGITNQMRRSAISISSNIAEGFKRSHRKEKLQFYNIAHGSTSELESQIEVSRKLNFLNSEDYQRVANLVIEIGKMLDGLIKSQDKNPKSYILNSIFFFIFLTPIFYILNPSLVIAAEIFIESEAKEIKVGDQFEVGFFINTESENINAIEGKIIFPSEILELKEIRDGESIINLWIERPKEQSIGNVIFSGITPGGFKSKKGEITSFIFEANQDGNASINISNASALKNDGKGTAAKVTTKNLEFRIQNLGEGQTLNPKSYILNPEKDTDPPESFKPEVAQSPDIFDGKYFLVFATQDKGSGIAGYEVREGFLGKFISAESPYLLLNQKLNKKIFIKSIDKEGNKRIEIIYPKNWFPWYENYWIIGIILLGIIIGYFIRRIWGKNLGFRI